MSQSDWELIVKELSTNLQLSLHRICSKVQHISQCHSSLLLDSTTAIRHMVVRMNMCDVRARVYWCKGRISDWSLECTGNLHNLGIPEDVINHRPWY